MRPRVEWREHEQVGIWIEQTRNKESEMEAIHFISGTIGVGSIFVILSDPQFPPPNLGCKCYAEMPDNSRYSAEIIKRDERNLLIQFDDKVVNAESISESEAGGPYNAPEMRIEHWKITSQEQEELVDHQRDG